jgi:hypothetical protein
MIKSLEILQCRPRRGFQWGAITNNVSQSLFAFRFTIYFLHFTFQCGCDPCSLNLDLRAFCTNGSKNAENSGNPSP